MQPCVPYAWQFRDEDVFMPAGNGAGLNCFALLSRNNHCRFATTQGRITSAFLIEQLERLSLEIDHATARTQVIKVIVLDNAPTHVAKCMRERRPVWEKRGLMLFFLPPYSPHLNLAEVLWRKLKYEWLKPEDYFESQTLFYRVNQALAAVGTLLHINFAPFNLG